jgi:hypothetical protein
MSRHRRTRRWRFALSTGQPVERWLWFGRGGAGLGAGRGGSPFHCVRLSAITDMAVIAAWLRLA